jgi:rare lipoprotein A
VKHRGMLAACAAVVFVLNSAPASAAERTRGERRAEASAARAEARRPDRPRTAARAQRGRASYYAPSLAGRRMADGGRFDPRSDAAAHRTLPLGSKAQVRNLRNGRSETVTVRDRGPHAPGRILDVSPGTAERLGMKDDGVAPVEVTPEAPRTGGGAQPRSAAGGGGPGRGPR